MTVLEEKIGYKFKNRDFLMEALTHSSFANERHGKIRCNERMEFLGDAVLSIISANFSCVIFLRIRSILTFRPNLNLILSFINELYNLDNF